VKKFGTSSPPCVLAVSRRTVVAGALASTLVRPAKAELTKPKNAFVAGGRRRGQALLGLVDRSGGVQEVIGLSGRAHSVAALRWRGEVIAVARRPDRWAIVIDPAKPQVAVTIRPTEGHNFSGHVAISLDSALAAFVEIRESDAVGFLSMREVGGAWREVGRLETSGIGPHMAAWLDERHIAVANGGYYDVGDVRSPDGSIGASLAVIDWMSGRPASFASTGVAYADYSLRHIAVAPEGLAVVLQRNGNSQADTPPAALWRGGGLVPMPAAAPMLDPLRGNCSDVIVVGDYIVTTSRLAGTIGAWRRSDRAWLGSAELADVGALAADDDGNCFATSKDGTLAGIAFEPGPVVGWQQHVTFGWDNHGTFL
jgi:hypothetical protein